MKRVIAFIIFMSAGLIYAEEVSLTNGDKITGEILREDEDQIVVKTEAMGIVTIKKEFVKKEGGEGIEWERKVIVGYDRDTGNTRESDLNARIIFNRETQDNEFTFKTNVTYSSVNRKMDEQEWGSTLRYAFSFANRKFYHFYKMDYEHDRFDSIDFRLLPSSGFGYWFSDTEDWKALFEAAIGYEYTEYNNETSDTAEMVLAPRIFFETKLFEKFKLSEDITVYPSLENEGQYRYHSETAIVRPFDECVSLRLALIIKYDSDPPENTKKRDTRFIAGLVFSF